MSLSIEQSDALRKPFPTEAIGKKPKITCGRCSKAQYRVCDSHQRSKCRVCGSYITSAHMHLDFVGHAEATQRLLDVDPHWDWEPLATDQNGLPAFDGNGGMWIRLTIGGTSRIGYGHPDGKTGGDAIKEVIGDAIRNAALRFGVAIELWGAHRDDEADAPAEPARAEPPREATEAEVALTALTRALNRFELDAATVVEDYRALYGVDPRKDEDPSNLREYVAGLEWCASQPAEPAEGDGPAEPAESSAPAEAEQQETTA